MHPIRRLAPIAAIALCLSAPSGALAQGEPLTLTLAIANEQGEPSQPAIDAFIEQVALLSDGTVVIEPLYGAGNATPEGFEHGVALLVQRGEADLGLNASRAWDLAGVTSLQALQAPFLITDGALADAVATSDIAERAVAGMADAGVTGLTLWPEDLRHPFALGAQTPLLSPDDFAGATILVQPSALSRAMVTALGSTLYTGDDRDLDAAEGRLQGAESGLLQGHTLPGSPTATGDVTFYPKFQMIVADSVAFDALTPEQQDILRAAAAETQRLTIAAHTSEADAAAAWCANGGTIALAGADGVAAFEAAAQPIFDAISADPLTAELIADIRALKAATTPAPGAGACAPAVGTDPLPVELLWSATGGADGMDYPASISLDPEGRLWVADTARGRFAIFEPDGTFVEYWGSPGTGDGQFSLQRSNGDGYGAAAFAPDGSFYVLDVGNHRVQHFDTDRRFLGSWGGLGSEPGQYRDPIGLAVDAQGVVYVLDDVRDVVETYDEEGSVLGAFHPDLAGLNSANSLALDAKGNVYISACCGAGNQVEVFDATGTPIATIGSAGTGQGQFIDQPLGMAIDAAGRLFVTQGPFDGRSVQVFDADGQYLTQWGGPGSGDTESTTPWGIVLDGQGNVYVSEAVYESVDTGANRIEKFRLLPPLAP